MELSVEYLIVIDKATHRAFYDLCDSHNELKRLLVKNAEFRFEGEKLIFKIDSSAELRIASGKVEGKDQRFFRCLLKFNEDESDIEKLACLLKTFRRTIADAGGQLQTLSSDLSAYYSERCYPAIHKTENQMRKLLKGFYGYPSWERLAC